MNNKNYLRGIDVSHYQNKIDWKQVKTSGIDYAMAKMTEGGSYVDPLFISNWQGMREQNIHAGAYHYYRALSNTPQEQADNICTALKTCDFQVGSSILAIDVEMIHNEQATPSQMADNLFLLIQLLQKQLLGTEHWPHIYCSPKTWTNHVAWQKYDFSSSPLWVAHWDVSEPTVPETWHQKGWSWWQTSSEGSVPGIEGYVDLDWVNASA